MKMQKRNLRNCRNGSEKQQIKNENGKTADQECPSGALLIFSYKRD